MSNNKDNDGTKADPRWDDGPLGEGLHYEQVRYEIKYGASPDQCLPYLQDALASIMAGRNGGNLETARIVAAGTVTTIYGQYPGDVIKSLYCDLMARNVAGVDFEEAILEAGKSLQVGQLTTIRRWNRPLNTKRIILNFGPHAGTPLPHVPASYLLWMVNLEPPHSQAEVAREELDRRGTVVPDLDVSNHAINRVSQSLLHVYLTDRRTEQHGPEGIYNWLCRVAQEALDNLEIRGGSLDDEGRATVEHMGLKFVFGNTAYWPVLLTVAPSWPDDAFRSEKCPTCGQDHMVYTGDDTCQP